MWAGFDHCRSLHCQLTLYGFKLIVCAVCKLKRLCIARFCATHLLWKPQNWIGVKLWWLTSEAGTPYVQYHTGLLVGRHLKEPVHTLNQCISRVYQSLQWRVWLYGGTRWPGSPLCGAARQCNPFWGMHFALTSHYHFVSRGRVDARASTGWIGWKWIRCGLQLSTVHHHDGGGLFGGRMPLDNLFVRPRIPFPYFCSAWQLSSS